MILAEIIAKLTDQDVIDTDADEICKQFQMDWNWCLAFEDIGFKTFSLGQWTCTDTPVGYRYITLDNAPMAFTAQHSRRGIVDFKWANQAIFEKARQRVREHLEDPIPILDFIDFTEDMDDGFFVKMGYQIETDEVILEATGDRWKVVKRYTENRDIDKWKTLKIKRDGKTKTVDVGEVIVPWVR